VIGTNKTCAQETVGLMVADLAMNKHFQPTDTDPAAIEALVRSRQPDLVSYPDWKKVDLAELAAGDASNRPRVKISNVNEMLELIRS
jgi:ferredoxin--NADP+ reductase